MTRGNTVGSQFIVHRIFAILRAKYAGDRYTIGMILFSGLSRLGALLYGYGQSALNRDTTVLA